MASLVNDNNESQCSLDIALDGTSELEEREIYVNYIPTRLGNVN